MSEIDEEVKRFLRERIPKDVARVNIQSGYDAIEFLKIDDPLSYKCKTSDYNAARIIFPHYLSGLLADMYRNQIKQIYILFRAKPPEFIETFYEYLSDRVCGNVVKLSDHTDECFECSIFEDLYMNASIGISDNKEEIKSLLKKPFGVQVWTLMLAFLRQDGYATFDDYLAKLDENKSRSL